MPTDLKKLHGPVIDAFVSNISPELEKSVTVPEDDFKVINRIIKVNRILSGEELSTHLFIIGKETPFTKLVDLPHPLPFNPQGKGSYQSYCCGKHRTMYRVGVFDKKFKILSDRWSFGDIGLDVAVGLVSEAGVVVEKCADMLRTY